MVFGLNSDTSIRQFHEPEKNKIFWGNFRKEATSTNKMVSKLNGDISLPQFRHQPEKNKIFWWNPRKEATLADFCLDSSLHGLKYLGQQDRHLSERIFWGLVVFCSIVVSGYFISTVFTKYNKSPVIVSFKPEETSIESIPFPALTVCNINNIQKSMAEKYFSNAKGPPSLDKTKHAQRSLYYLDHICNSAPAFSRLFNYSLFKTKVDPHLLRTVNVSLAEESQGDISKFFENASQNCSELVRLCVWRGKPIVCEKIFQGIETDYGFCCVFNMVPQSLLHVYRNDSRDSEDTIRRWQEWDVEKDGLLLTRKRPVNGVKVPRRQKLAGKSSGLSILLDPDINEYFCTNTDSVGFQIAVHLPIDVPHVVDKGVAIKPNSEVFVDIKAEITTAKANILEFSLEKRNCYYQDEFRLHFYKYYSASNCVDECLANKTYEICHCVRYYMPRDDSRGLCSNDNYDCTETVTRRFFDEGAEKFCGFCLPSCEEIHYFSETTFIPIRDTSIWENEKGKPDWANKNVSIVHIFFGAGRTYSRVRSELYGITDLIANTGGLLGLCLGFSGISLIEIIYFLTIRAYCAKKKRKHMDAEIIENNSHYKKNTWHKEVINGEAITDLHSFYKRNAKLNHSISIDVNSYLQ